MGSVLTQLAIPRFLRIQKSEMYLHEIQVVADKETALNAVEKTVAVFNNQICCITNAYNVLLKRQLQLPEWRKLYARLTTNTGKVRASEEDFGAMRIWHEFDFAEYASANSTERKRLILDTVHAILLRAASQYHWQESIIHEATHRIQEAGYRLAVLSRKKWRHPNKRLSMQIECRFDLDVYQLTGVLSKSRHGEVARYDLGAGRATPSYFDRYLSDAQWVSPEVFELSSSSGFHQKSWTCEIDPALLT